MGVSSIEPKRTRGKTVAGANRRRQKDAPVSTIALSIDLSQQPEFAKLLDRQLWELYNLYRALTRESQRRCRHLQAERTRTKGQPQKARNAHLKAFQESIGLSREGFAASARKHADRSEWLMHHTSKALVQNFADWVWTTASRHLFPDKGGDYAGPPRIAKFADFERLIGRARSHTKPPRKKDGAPVWETYALRGSLEGHVAVYGVSGASKIRQPARMGLVDGALEVQFVHHNTTYRAPVRLPEGLGAWPRVEHFLADPDVWHKMDLCKVVDPSAPGGARWQGHLLVEKAGYTAPSTIARRAAIDLDRIAGLDVNCSGIGLASMCLDDQDSLHVELHTLDEGVERRAAKAAKKQRERNKALARSRRNANPGQYARSSRQRARDARRAAAGLPPVQDANTGRRKVRRDGRRPLQPYRKDTLTGNYLGLKAQAGKAGAAMRFDKDRVARIFAEDAVTKHGAHFRGEKVNIAAWQQNWGRSIHAYTPGRLQAALRAECLDAGGSFELFPTILAASQHCTCGRREKKTLDIRHHTCPACGLDLHRDEMSAIQAMTVVGEGAQSAFDPELRNLAHTRLLEAQATRTKAQEEGPDSQPRHPSATPAAGYSTAAADTPVSGHCHNEKVMTFDDPSGAPAALVTSDATTGRKSRRRLSRC